MRITLSLLICASSLSNVFAMSSDRPIDLLCGEKVETTVLTKKRIYKLDQSALKKAGLPYLVEALAHKDNIHYTKEFVPTTPDPFNQKKSVINTFHNTIGSFLEKSYATERKVKVGQTHCKFISDKSDKLLFEDKGFVGDTRRKLSLTALYGYDVTFECFVLAEKSLENLRRAQCEVMENCMLRQTDKVVLEEFKNQKDLYCTGDVNLAVKPSPALNKNINDDERSRIKEVKTSKKLKMDLKEIRPIEVNGAIKE